MSLKLKFVNGSDYETYSTKEVKKEHKHEAKSDEKTESAEEEQEAPVPPVTHKNNIFNSFFPNVEMYIINQQIYNSNGLYAHESYFFNNFKVAISEYKGVLHCERYDNEELPDEIMEAPLSEPFFTKKMKMFSRPDSFMLYSKLGVDFFSTSELLYPNMKVRLRLIRARPNFYMISDNPNVSLANVDCSLYTRRIALKDDFYKKRMDMLAYTPVEFNYLKLLAKTFIVPARQNQFIQENIFNNAPVRRVAIAMNTNSAFTGSYNGNTFWYQRFDLRQIRILRGSQPIVDFDAANNCRLYVTMKTMNCQDDIPSIAIDNFKDYYVLVFDLTSMQDATEKCHYPELIGEPVRLELDFTFLLEHVTELIVLGERMSSVAVDKLLEKTSKLDNVSLQQLINRIPLLKYQYRGSFPSDYVPTLDNDTFAIKNTQPSNMQFEHCIMIANSRRKMYFADCLGLKSTVSSSSNMNRCCQIHCSPIPAFAVCTRYMQFFISSIFDKTKLQEFTMLMCFHS